MLISTQLDTLGDLLRTKKVCRDLCASLLGYLSTRVPFGRHGKSWITRFMHFSEDVCLGLRWCACPSHHVLYVMPHNRIYATRQTRTVSLCQINFRLFARTRGGLSARRAPLGLIFPTIYASFPRVIAVVRLRSHSVDWSAREVSCRGCAPRMFWNSIC